MPKLISILFNHFFLFIILTFSLFACENDIRPKEYIIAQTKEINFKIPPTILGSSKWCAPLSINGNSYLFKYHYMEHKIELWNMDEKSIVEEISLEREGPNAINDIISFYPHRLDSIFLMSFSDIYLINMEGEVLEKIFINNSEKSSVTGIDFNTFNFYNDLQNTNPIFFRKGYFYVSIKRYGRKLDYSHKIIGKLKWNSKEFTFLPISYPKAFQENYYGSFDKPNITYLDNNIIVSFKHTNSFYKYDYEGNLLLKSDEKKYSQRFTVTPFVTTSHITQNKVFDHFKKNPLLLPAYHNPRDNYFYQVVIQPSQSEGTSNRKFLCVYDNEFNQLGIMELSQEMIPTNLFADRYGFHMIKKTNNEQLVSFLSFETKLK